MLPSLPLLRRLLGEVVAELEAQGFDVDAVAGELAGVPDSYDALDRLAARLAGAPRRAGWPHVEPTALDAIAAECDGSFDGEPLGRLEPALAAERARTAFLGSVSGCILGKPLELSLTHDEIRAALEANGDWPLDDYLSERVVLALPAQQGQWPECVRERIDHVAPDDDINYTILGMLALEMFGASFTAEQLKLLWLLNLPVVATFGPERTTLVKAAIDSIEHPLFGGDPSGWADRWNPGAELCGALIRVDAYAYACLGDPGRAAAMAWRDASMTHRGTGLYSAMFTAAAIAAAPVVDDPLDVFEVARRFVPRRSRLHGWLGESLDLVAAAGDWLEGYRSVHARFGEYGHCRVVQELGTLMNTVRFATSVGDGICRQVAQGNDTDSFGATAGSILGARFGPTGLDRRWVDPFGDRLHTALALFHEQSLGAVADRMAALPARLDGRPEGTGLDILSHDPRPGDPPTP